MSEPLSGTQGYVKVNGVLKPADKWSGDFDQGVVDRMNFLTGGEPANARGQRTGEMVIEGPYEGPMGIERGNLYTFLLGAAAVPGLFITATGRVSKLSFSNDASSGPRFTIRAAQYGALGVTTM